jgi:predicted transglutaminase-like cysteine proteinase
MGREMGLPGCTRGLRTVALACGLAWFSPATGLVAATLDSVGAFDAGVRPDQPFGLSVSTVPTGALQDKWLGLKRKLDDERVQIALCDGDRDRCASDAALQFLAIVDSARLREGRARLGEINRAINLAIRPVSDLAQYGEIDVWSPPLQTFEHGAGDCEDYAIAKFMALRQAGIAADDLRIVILRDTIHGEDHAVAATRLDGHWLMLDNRRMAMVEDIHVRNYRPLFVIDQSGIMKYSEQPLLARGPDRDLAPSLPADPMTQPGLIAAFE